MATRATLLVTEIDNLAVPPGEVVDRAGICLRAVRLPPGVRIISKTDTGLVAAWRLADVAHLLHVDSQILVDTGFVTSNDDPETGAGVARKAGGGTATGRDSPGTLTLLSPVAHRVGSRPSRRCCSGGAVSMGETGRRRDRGI